MTTDNITATETMNRLMTAAVEVMQRRIAEDYAAMREEQAAGFAANCGVANNGNWYIDTRLTRDERRSNNGGEYSYWTEYWHADGRTYRQERASCDFWLAHRLPEVCDGFFFGDALLEIVNQRAIDATNAGDFETARAEAEMYSKARHLLYETE